MTKAEQDWSRSFSKSLDVLQRLADEARKDFENSRREFSDA